MRTDLKLEDYFVKGTALGWLKRRHPYDFIETYSLLRNVYGYQSYYVNLGLWDEALVAESGGLDAASRLVKFLCQKSGPMEQKKILDVGSGLGQSAVHYIQWLKAQKVVGLNLNERQIAFANALAGIHGLEKNIEHKKLDACSGFEAELGRDEFDAIFAVECIGHFKHPELFLKSAFAALKTGGVFVCCLNVGKKDFSLGLKAMFKTTYGFIPEKQSIWTKRLELAGFKLHDQGDITNAVLEKGSQSALTQLEKTEIRKGLPKLLVGVLRKQLQMVEKGVAAGELGYVWIVAKKK